MNDDVLDLSELADLLAWAFSVAVGVMIASWVADVLLPWIERHQRT